MGKSDSNRTTIPVPLIALFVYTISKQNMPPKKHLRFPTQILFTLLLSIQTTIDQLKHCFNVLHRYQHCIYWSHPIGDSTGLQFFCFVSIDEVETVRVTRVKDSLSNNDWGIRSSNTSALGHTINMGSNCIGRCYGDIFTRQPGKLHFSFPVHSLCIFILSTATTTMPTDSKQTQSVSGIRTFRAANIALKQKCHLFVCRHFCLFSPPSDGVISSIAEREIECVAS